MKKCFIIDNWEEKKVFYISGDENTLFIPNETNSYNEKSNITDKILEEICKLMPGVKMYNNYIVFDVLKNDMIVGDFNIWEEEALNTKQKYFCCQYFTLRGRKGDLQYLNTKFDYSGNIFKEYFLFLKNEDNKWNKLKKIIEDF